jgi:hypothetical protein
MDAKTFDELVAKRIGKCISILCQKAEGYAAPEDRLHNFKVAASLQGITPREAIRGMMAKHTVSVYDMCKSNTVYPDAVWDEKLTDSINYLLLLEAIIQDENSEKREAEMQRIVSDVEAYVEEIKKEKGL